MYDLVILADDLTGALDTGVQFSARSVPVCVRTEPAFPLPNTAACRVLSLNTDARHLDVQDAYDRTHRLATQARRAGAKALYIKTDSALRGNVGAYLQAAADAWNTGVHFAPAYPENGRTISGGKLYIDGIPLSQSVYSRDLHNPALQDEVAAYIHAQSDIAVYDGLRHTRHGEKAVYLYEAASEPEMQAAADRLQASGEATLLAGCAGFAAYLPALLSLRTEEKPAFKPGKPLLILSASTHAATLAQLQHGLRTGMQRIPFADILSESPDYDALAEAAMQRLHDPCAALTAANSQPDVDRTTRQATALGLDTRQTGLRIAENLGQAALHIFMRGFAGTLCVFGGDTLASVLRALSVDTLRPLAEIAPGVVLSQMHWRGSKRYLISKSGGFGQLEIIETLLRYLR